jgi:hypothetical protein
MLQSLIAWCRDLKKTIDMNRYDNYVSDPLSAIFAKTRIFIMLILAAL